MTGNALSQRALVRLVRFALASAPLVRPVGDGSGVQLSGRDGTRRPATAALLAEALSRGLLQQGPDGYRATPLARDFLRRTAADIEEDAFQTQHRELETRTVELGRQRQTVRVNRLESPLGAMTRLKDRDGSPYFPPETIAAGERLSGEFERAGLQPRVTSIWEPRLSTAPRRRAAPEATMTDSAAAARHRLGLALDRLGPDLAGVALDVCCFGKGLELVERERQWPARSAKLMLRTALAALVRHYAPPPARPRSRHWGAEDFRPEL